jgi:hypothetical protein
MIHKRRVAILILAALLSVGGYAAIGDVVTFLAASGSGVTVDSSGNLLPVVDNDVTSGSSSYRWSECNAVKVAARNVSLTSTSSNTTATFTVSSGTTLRVIGTVAGNFTWTIPSAATAGADSVIHIVDQSGSLDGTHTMTINATSGNINGSSTKSFATAYGHLWLESNGTNWFAH